MDQQRFRFVSSQFVDRRIRDFLLLILMYVNGIFSMLKKQKRRLHTYTFLDLCREGKAEVTWNTFQKKCFKCKEK